MCCHCHLSTHGGDAGEVSFWDFYFLFFWESKPLFVLRGIGEWVKVTAAVTHR